MSEAQARKVDSQTRKIILAHGEIKNLDMPPMTMVFEVNPGAAFDKFKAGDKARFRADKADDKYTVMQLEVAK